MNFYSFWEKWNDQTMQRNYQKTIPEDFDIYQDEI